MKTIYYFIRRAYGREIRYPLTPMLAAVHNKLTKCETYTEEHLQLYSWLGCDIQLVEEPKKWTPLGYPGMPPELNR